MTSVFGCTWLWLWIDGPKAHLKGSPDHPRPSEERDERYEHRKQ